MDTSDTYSTVIKNGSPVIENGPVVIDNYRIPFITNNATVCPICMDPIDDAELEIFMCLHSFHRVCIARWLRLKRTCPLCREEIREDEEIYYDSDAIFRKMFITLVTDVAVHGLRTEETESEVGVIIDYIYNRCKIELKSLIDVKDSDDMDATDLQMNLDQLNYASIDRTRPGHSPLYAYFLKKVQKDIDNALEYIKYS